MVSDAKREIVFASDNAVATFEDIQYALGEGPSLDVFTSRRPVLVPNLRAPAATARWPALTGEVESLGLGSVFCFPLRLGAVSAGVCTFYRRETGSLTEGQVGFVLAVVDLTTLALLERKQGLPGASLLELWIDLNGPGRFKIHQATGMVMSQLDLPADAALDRLRGAAYARGVPLDRFAGAIISRDIRLQSDSETS